MKKQDEEGLRLNYIRRSVDPKLDSTTSKKSGLQS